MISYASDLVLRQQERSSEWLLTHIDRPYRERPDIAKVKPTGKLRKIRVFPSSDRMFDGEDHKLDQKITTNNGE